MTKQNHIHKSLVVRQKGRKDVRKFLSGIPNTFNDEKYRINVKRRKTYCKAFYKRMHKEVKRIDD